MRDIVMYIMVLINVVSMFGMVGTILMHSGKGGGLSDMFGGGSGAFFRGREGRGAYVRSG